jgi:hypothetical protein
MDAASIKKYLDDWLRARERKRICDRCKEGRDQPYNKIENLRAKTS